MRIIGATLSWLLNINTVWGGLILVAFGLTVVQHYLPTTSVIPGDLLRPGDNAVTIAVAGRNNQVRKLELTIRVEPDGLHLPPPAPSSADRPRLIRARLQGGACLMTWDDATHGRYEITVDGRPAARGRLVTLQALTDAAFDYAQTAFDIALGLVAAMVLFLGLMKVGEDAGIVQLAARLLHPVIRILFPDVPRDHPASGAILMNFATTILGLGNAATPFGLKAMKELQTLNPHPEVATNAQVMLLAYNTAGLALLPTTLLAVRKAAGCSDPFEVIGTCLVTGAVSTVTAVVLARLLAGLPLFSVRAALSEGKGSACVASPDSPAPTGGDVKGGDA